MNPLFELALAAHQPAQSATWTPLRATRSVAPSDYPERRRSGMPGSNWESNSALHGAPAVPVWAEAHCERM